MTQQQEIQRNMYERVVNILNINKESFANNEPLMKLMEQVNDAVNQIDKAANKQKFRKYTTTLEREEIRNAMAEKANAVRGIIYAYAINTKDKDLLRIINFCYTDLARARKNICGERCAFIYEVANKFQTQLNAYGLTLESLQELKKRVEAFEHVVNIPRWNLTNSVSNSSVIYDSIIRTNSLLRHVGDKLMLQYMTTHPDFYLEYKAARMLAETVKINAPRVKRRRRHEAETEVPEN
jgi:hypothetical protein